MPDLDLRHELDRAAGRIATPTSPPAQLMGQVRKRRQARTVGRYLVAASLAVALVGGTLSLRGGSADQVTVAAEPRTEPPALGHRPLPPGPLVAREGQVAVWTGSALFVWGGQRGDGEGRQVFADGALYDPVTGSWTMVPPSPLPGRAAAGGAWTGTEVVIAGGVGDRYGTEALRDAAAFNPTTGTWRELPPMPTDRYHPFTGTIGSRVLFAGGQSPTSGPQLNTVAILDTSAGTWTDADAGAPVYAATPDGGRLVLATMAPDGQGGPTIRFLDPADGTVTKAPALPFTGDASAISVAADRGRVAVGIEARGDVTLTELIDGTWADPITIDDSDFTPAQRRGDPRPATSTLQDSWLIADQAGRVRAIELGTGATVSADLTARTCSAGGTATVAGGRLLVFGGQSCDPEEHSVPVASGTEIDLTSPTGN